MDLLVAHMDWTYGMYVSEPRIQLVKHAPLVDRDLIHLIGQDESYHLGPPRRVGPVVLAFRDVEVHVPAVLLGMSKARSLHGLVSIEQIREIHFGLECEYSIWSKPFQFF